MKKVAIVVVTFNRKDLLKKSIECLKKQEYKDYDIFVIDNASTDGTMLAMNEYVDNKEIFYYNTGRNLGGAGGFNYGMNLAVSKGYEYVWIMDDDTMATPNSLSELMNADKILNHEYGFLSSVVLWKDGKYCEMNKQKIEKKWYDKIELLKHGLLKTYHATFVSFFIRSEIVKKEGLPIKEFFIWGDDVEYTNRLSKKYNCYVVGNSQVIHEIKNNSGSNIAKDDVERIGRYKYAYRNEMYVARKNGAKGVLRQICKICLHIFRVIFSKNKGKLKKLGIIIGSSINGIFFNPKVEFVSGE